MNKSNSIFNEIVTNIIAGVLKPRERLVERDLIDKFGASRTPIREAIQRLDTIGLVQTIPNKGAMVIEFFPKDVENLYLVRIPLECLAAKLAFPNLGIVEIEKLQEINYQLQTFLNTSGLLQKIEKDKQFHLTICNASQNKFLIQIIQDLRLKCYTVAYYAWADPNRVKASVFEHGEMIKALKERNKVKFQKWVKHQLVSSKKAYLEYLRRIQP